MRTNKLRGYGVLFMLIFPVNSGLLAQSKPMLSLAECYTQAREQYPLTRQRELIAKSTEYSMENASKGYLPQLTFAGQASYQSAVTQIPIKIPNQNIPTLSKDQYRIYGEVYQPLAEVTVISKQKELLEINGTIEQDKLEVELYKLNDRINQLYFGILLIDAQTAQIQLVKSDLGDALKKMDALIANGVAFRHNADVLKAELLKAEQKEIELVAGRKAYLAMLGEFMGRSLSDSTELIKPAPAMAARYNLNDSFSRRPESLLFTHQLAALSLQQKYLYAKNLPRVGLFFQGGLGRPGLNMLNNDLAGYYIGGLRFNWNFSNTYTFRNDKKILGLNRSMVQMQRELFVFSTGLQVSQQSVEEQKWRDLIAKDREIIQLRESIKKTTRVQMENGTATATDFTRELNAEDLAKQNLALHEMQLLMTQYALKTTTGNTN